MIADGVDRHRRRAARTAGRVGDRRAFLVEHAIAQPLRLAHFGGGLRQPHLERAEPAERSAPAGARARPRPAGRHRPAASTSDSGTPAGGRRAERARTGCAASCGCRGWPWDFGPSRRRSRESARISAPANRRSRRQLPYSMGRTRIYDNVAEAARSGRKRRSARPPVAAPRAAARGRAAWSGSRPCRRRGRRRGPRR